MMVSSQSASVVVSGAFDDLRSPQIRFLQEASRFGELTALLWSDDAVQRMTGTPPKFPQAERAYLLGAIRCVERVVVVDKVAHTDRLPEMPGLSPQTWVVPEREDASAKRAYSSARGLTYAVVKDAELQGFPEWTTVSSAAGPARKKVVVTGCYDWVHSGHVRFFEEVSTYGDLYVIVGHDANLRLLKGPGHPLFPQDERRYVVGSIRHVKQALITSGEGWLDADPEIRRIKPDIYAVNEDGDKGGKREYCAELGIQYLVLKRTPAPGLPRRTSTDLRGF